MYEALEEHRRRGGLPRRLHEERNSIAHSAAIASAQIDLFVGSSRLRVVLEANLMLDLGMDAAVVGSCITRAYSKSPWVLKSH